MKTKYRFKFAKQDRMRFIGHIDLLKLFQKTIKKSNLPIAYSEGFNPHQKMSFALPLPLGFASTAEYVDITFTQEIDTKHVIQILNENFPIGISIINISLLDFDAKNAASTLQAAEYIIEFPPIDNIKDIINDILISKELEVERKSKSGMKITNIRDDIFEIQIIQDISKLEMQNSDVCANNVAYNFKKYCKLNVKISAGSTFNLKPELLMKLIYDKANLDFIKDEFKIKYLRTKMFGTSGDFNYNVGTKL